MSLVRFVMSYSILHLLNRVFMKQIKRKLIDILNRELLIDKSLINEQAYLNSNLQINNRQLDLLLYYCEKDMNIMIPDEQISIDQNIQEFISSIYLIKKSNNKMLKAS